MPMVILKSKIRSLVLPVLLITALLLLLLLLLCCMCIVVLGVYCCFLYTLDAGLLARSQYLEGLVTGHLDTGFS
jgi:hypothetical protein